MWTSVFRGLMMALAVTVLALVVVVGMAWWGVGAQYMLLSVDVGLVLSCFVAGYYGACATSRIMPGVVAALAYVVLAILLLSFYFQVLPFGAVKVLTGAVLLAMVSALVGKGRSMYRAQDAEYQSASGRYIRQLEDPNCIGRRPDSMTSLRTPDSERGQTRLNYRYRRPAYKRPAVAERRSDSIAEDASLSYRIPASPASQEKNRSYSFRGTRPKKSGFSKLSSLFRTEGARGTGSIERNPYRASEEIPHWYMRGRRGSR
ncbi:MAG: TIGR04086 family membrane protein [Peptococcaceae bacterium]|nr:TIGR04086 family membrane protein [Peptococcaceae bacterium]